MPWLVCELCANCSNKSVIAEIENEAVESKNVIVMWFAREWMEKIKGIVYEFCHQKLLIKTQNLSLELFGECVGYKLFLKKIDTQTLRNPGFSYRFAWK